MCGKPHWQSPYWFEKGLTKTTWSDTLRLRQEGSRSCCCHDTGPLPARYRLLINSLIRHRKSPLRGLQIGLSQGSKQQSVLCCPHASVSCDLLTYFFVNIFQKDKNAAIVYCRTREATENLANMLTKRGLTSLAYHGGQYCLH